MKIYKKTCIIKLEKLLPFIPTELKERKKTEIRE